jgi:hypothetical protein
MLFTRTPAVLDPTVMLREFCLIKRRSWLQVEIRCCSRMGFARIPLYAVYSSIAASGHKCASASKSAEGITAANFENRQHLGFIDEPADDLFNLLQNLFTISSLVAVHRSGQAPIILVENRAQPPWTLPLPSICSSSCSRSHSSTTKPRRESRRGSTRIKPQSRDLSSSRWAPTVCRRGLMGLSRPNPAAATERDR